MILSLKNKESDRERERREKELLYAKLMFQQFIMNMFKIW